MVDRETKGRMLGIKEHTNQYINSTVNIKQDVSADIMKECAVIVYLYYFDEHMDWYLKYLKALPVQIKVYIISSNKELLDDLERRRECCEQWEFILKENRGRDMSALLIAARFIVEKYKYVCFLHDKKANKHYLENDVEIWEWNLWENTVASNAYVTNVIDIFDKDSTVGILLPPARTGEYVTDWYGDAAWGDNYDLCVKLAKKMNLKVIPQREDRVLSVGSFFWVRSECLKKLYSLQWKYTDFVDEPMPDDGTISHAVERIFPYLAEDMGMKSGIIMTEEYAGWLIEYARRCMGKMLSLLHSKLGIYSMHGVNVHNELEVKIIQYALKYKKLYIYGAGEWGNRIYDYLVSKGIVPTGFIVSRMDNINRTMGIPICELSELKYDIDVGIIVAVAVMKQDEIINNLKNYGIENYFIGVG